jgi:hypothetical protein
MLSSEYLIESNPLEIVKALPMRIIVVIAGGEALKNNTKKVRN